MGLVLVVASAASAGAGGDAWWSPEWSERRAVTTQDPARGRPPSEIALVEIATNGHMRPDGADLRVIDAAGTPIQREVLASADEDRAIVLFPAKPRSRYTVYFGNEKAPAPRPWTAPAWLVLESRGRSRTDSTRSGRSGMCF